MSHNNNMKIKYRYDKNKMVINFESFNQNMDINILRNYINLILNKQKFLGSHIIIYLNNILIGTFYLTDYYLRRIYNIKNNYLNQNNNFFDTLKPIEIEYKNNYY